MKIRRSGQGKLTRKKFSLQRGFPLVTIITPAYNRDDLIEETIKSVLGQDYPNIEYIVLDDGSTDETLKIIKRYGKKLTWESHANMGETKTVNLGFKMAKGDIIGVVNSDDPLLPGAISEIVKVMSDNPKLSVVYPDWKMIDENSKLIKQVSTREFNYLDMIRWHICMPGPGAFFRKKIVEKLKGRDKQYRYVGDYDFWLRAGLMGQFMRIPKTLATFRVHSRSASIEQKGKLMAEEHINVIKNFYSHTKFSKEILKIKNEALSSAYYYAGMNSTDQNFKKQYFFMSLSLSPVNILFKQKRWRGYILRELFGQLPLNIIAKIAGRYLNI